MLDFDVIRRNAAEQGVSLAEIAVFYEKLDEDEIAVLEGMGLVSYKNGTSIVGRFTKSGEVLFPNKVVGIHSLGA